jgi:hypothetical protein
MTMKLIQHTSVFNAGSPSIITIAPSQARSLIIVMLSTSETINSIVDNAPDGSSIYVQVPNAVATNAGAGLTCDIWYTANSHQKATAITVTLGGNTPNVLWIFEVQIMNSSSPLQEVGIVNDGAATTTIVGASVITSNALDFIANVTLVNDTITNITAGNNFTIGDIEQGHASAYLITSQKGTYNPAFDAFLSDFCSSTASFREAPHSIDVRGISKKRMIRPDYYEG